MQGGFNGTLNTTAFCQGPTGPETQVQATVQVLITSITPDPNNPGQSRVEGQAMVSNICGQTIASTLSGATLDNSTNTLRLGTIGSGGNQVSFSDGPLSGNTIRTSIGLLLNGQAIPLGNSDVTLTR
jgi:hypothetical protein